MRGLVRAVRLDVLMPPAAEPFDCDMIAFQEVSNETVEANRIAQTFATADQDSAPIDGIPREGTKLFVASGLDAQDDPIIVGCGELGLIEGDERVDIVAEPVTILSPPPLQVGAALPSPMRFSLTDIAGHTMVGDTVKWRVYGPGVDNQTSGTATTNASGDAVLSIQVPEEPGPAAVIARARWTIDAPEPVIGFALTEPILIDVPVNTTTIARNARSALVGDFGPDGQVGIAVFGEPSGGAPGRAVFVAYRDGDAYATIESPPMLGLLTLGKVRSDGRDELFGIIGDRWVEIRPDGTLFPTVIATAGVTADEIVSIGPCEGSGGDVALVRADNQWIAIGVNKQVTTSPFATPPTNATRLVGSGCVSTTSGALRRTVVYAGDQVLPTVVADASGIRSTEWVTFGGSAGFSRALTGNSAPLLGVEVDTDGVSIARYELLTVGADELELQKIDEDDVITVPQTPIGADLDGDGALDVAALLDFGIDDQSQTAFRAMIALGVDVEGTRLAGVSGQQEARAVQLLVADMDGDGDDDVILVSENQIAIIPMGSPE